jgi:hypothetical protein
MKKLILTILFCPLLVLGAQTAQFVLSNAVSWGYGSVAPGDLMSIDAYAWMAPVGAGSAQASLSNAMVNGYGALSPGDLETVIAYGAANGSGNSSLSNNPATTNGTAALITFIQQNSIGGTGATNINVSGVLSGGSGVTTTIPAAFSTAGSNYMAQVAAQKATASTNGYPWSSLYDLVGAATTSAYNATNGYPWGAKYDAAGAANAAAYNATNGYPWGANYDAAGAATAAAAGAVYTAAQAASIIAAQAAQAATNGYPWGTVATASANSFTTNFNLTAYPTNITITLPSASANYIVEEELFITAKSANPYGAALPIGEKIPAKYIFDGQTYQAIPISESTSGNNFVFSYNGGTVSFVDQVGVNQSFNQAKFMASFSITARYIWTVHK